MRAQVNLRLAHCLLFVGVLAGWSAAEVQDHESDLTSLIRETQKSVSTNETLTVA